MFTTAGSNGSKLGYRTFGDGARDVLLVHGWMVSGAVWNDNVEAIDRTRLRLIVPDLRGTGDSEAAGDWLSALRPSSARETPHARRGLG